MKIARKCDANDGNRMRASSMHAVHSLPPEDVARRSWPGFEQALQQEHLKQALGED
jgi:hypothetical protein